MHCWIALIGFANWSWSVVVVYTFTHYSEWHWIIFSNTLYIAILSTNKTKMARCSGPINHQHLGGIDLSVTKMNKKVLCDYPFYVEFNCIQAAKHNRCWPNFHSLVHIVSCHFCVDMFKNNHTTPYIYKSRF